ncbi:MAG TPA: DUF3795 domain-containing protein [Candidatus Binatia bacterium]|nr:DUF3795 domain-containing protein [Candidatus Binatia bacterium]
METKQNRRHFLKTCAKSGAACCVLMAWNRNLPAMEGPEEKQEQKLKPIDFSKLSYCGVPCAQVCELYKATLENNVGMKKILHERQEMKEKFGLEFDPEKVFCHTCKPGDKPKKVGMDTCVIRICAMANNMESCVQCKNLFACDQEYWKKWPGLYAFNKKNQARFLAEPGVILRELKAVQ